MTTPLGFQSIHPDIQEFIFKGRDEPYLSKRDLAKIKSEYEKFGLTLPTEFSLQQLNVSIPDNLEDLISAKWEPYKESIKALAASKMPPKPSVSDLVINPGWTRYTKDSEGFHTESVKHPKESTFVLDTETLVKCRSYPVLAVAVSAKAWYLWIHPYLTGQVNFNNRSFLDLNMLISVGTNKTILGFNVKYDSARIQETFNLHEVKNHYFDLMSAHVAYCGMSGKQRDLFKGYRSCSIKFFPGKWIEKTSQNNLVDAWSFHTGQYGSYQEKKETRDLFVTANSLADIHQNLTELLEYTLNDGVKTYQLAQAIVPKYFHSNPHIITLAGHLLINSSILPVPHSYPEQIKEIDRVWSEKKQSLNRSLKLLVEESLKKWQDGYEVSEDPWLKNLDWTPAKTGKNKGLPKWYRDIKGPITSKSRITPYLLQVRWKGQPIIHLGKAYGWCYPTNTEELKDYTQFELGGLSYSKIPHKDGDDARTGNPLGKGYIESASNGTLSSDNLLGDDFLKKSAELTYWESSRKRVYQYVPRVSQDDPSTLLIDPQIIAHGTSSRRCVESLWLTACQPKASKPGSELLSMVRPSDSYKLVGCDFDGQETKIFAMFGDALLGHIYGASPTALIQLIGTKEDKNDAHWMTAKWAGITRDEAKPLNFSMNYLGGRVTLKNGLKALHPEWSEAECLRIADLALTKKRGKKNRSNGLFEDGSDSACFNFMIPYGNHTSLPWHLSELQDFSEGFPRTPLLKSAISQAISMEHCGNDYLTSRANWGIQSTGVDLLHYLIVTVDTLNTLTETEARFVFSRHDEVWYNCHQDHTMKLAKNMQTASVLAWGSLAESLGFSSLPEAYAWFSGVNIDNCLRKEVRLSTVTPSHSEHIENGIELKPTEILN